MYPKRQKNTIKLEKSKLSRRNAEKKYKTNQQELAKGKKKNSVKINKH